MACRPEAPGTALLWYETDNIAVETMLTIIAMTPHSKPHVVIVGGGIGGLFAAKNGACL
jgi:spermidine synthase